MPKTTTNAPQVWDYIYMGGEMPAGCPIPADLLQRMRREFEYWYPFDLRVSGKDLIQASVLSRCVNWQPASSDRGLRVLACPPPVPLHPGTRVNRPFSAIPSD